MYMYAQDMVMLGSQRSVIRELFEYGKQRAALKVAGNLAGVYPQRFHGTPHGLATAKRARAG